MTKINITLDIKNCSECPLLKLETSYGEDSWDRGNKWICGQNSKVIDSHVTQSEHRLMKVPVKCPARIDDNNNEEKK